MNPRRGTVLIFVAGVSAMVAALALGLLTRMRSDGDESFAHARVIQARLMLSAALMYVDETARIGWGEEAYGWMDIRDGRPGPRGRLGQRLFVCGDDAVGGAFPAIAVDGDDAYVAARCPMYTMRRPPWAIRPRLTANPVPRDPTKSWADLVSAVDLDPQPDLADPSAANAFAQFAAGDPRPARPASSPGWFRVRRTGIATFLLTCGSGASKGFRTWSEVEAAGAQDEFGSEPDFAEVAANEVRTWYVVDWCAAVSVDVSNHYRDHLGFRLAGLGSPRLGASEWPSPDDHNVSRQTAGTFTMIERLRDAPAHW